MFHKTNARYHVENLADFDINRVIEPSRGDKSNTYKEHRDCIIVENESGTGLVLLSNRFLRSYPANIDENSLDSYFFDETLFRGWGYERLSKYFLGGSVDDIINVSGYRFRLLNSVKGNIGRMERALKNKPVQNGFTFSISAFNFINYPERVPQERREHKAKG